MDKNRSAFERTEIMLGNQASALMGHVIFMLLNIDKLRITHFLTKMKMAEKPLI